MSYRRGYGWGSMLLCVKYFQLACNKNQKHACGRTHGLARPLFWECLLENFAPNLSYDVEKVPYHIYRDYISFSEFFSNDSLELIIEENAWKK